MVQTQPITLDGIKMPKFDALYTYPRAGPRGKFIAWVLVRAAVITGVIFVGLFVLSEVLFRGSVLDGALRLATAQEWPDTPIPVHHAYVGVGVGVFGGVILYLLAIVVNFLLAPPGGKLRNLVVKDDKYATSTYECGQVPIGSGQQQINLAYYTFALVFIAFDIITALTLMFAIVFSANTQMSTVLGVPWIPSTNDVLLQVVAILVFIIPPLLILGFWMRRKAILWQ